MNCQQKSGVFLNLECQNAIKNTCSNCEKQVCKNHSHILKELLYCEDCYWERFLFAEQIVKNQNHTDTMIMTTNDSYASTSGGTTSSNNQPEGFEGGFGGGEFGGGGATGAWTEGDMQSLSDSNNSNNLMSDTADDTFFYS